MTPQDFGEFRHRLVAGQRVPVGAVPRDRVPVRCEGPVVREAVPRADRHRAGPVGATVGRADAVGRVPRRTGEVLGSVRAKPRTRLRDTVVGCVARDRGEVRRHLGAGRGPAPARRAGGRLACPTRGDGRADDRHQARHGRLVRQRLTWRFPGSTCATTRTSGTCGRRSSLQDETVSWSMSTVWPSLHSALMVTGASQSAWLSLIGAAAAWCSLLH